MKELNQDIKTKNFKSIYLLFGEETFLKKSYQDKIIAGLLSEEDKLMNFEIFDGKNCSVDEIYDAFTTYSFMVPRRVVLVKDSNLFYTGRKEDTEKMLDYIQHVPESSVLLFVEQQVDKRGRLYKYVNKNGKAVEMKPPQEKEIILWIQKIFKAHNKNIDAGTAVYLYRNVPQQMENIQHEVLKLVDYKATETEITVQDIDAVCSKSLEVKIFDLVAAVGNKNLSKALDIYQNLLLMKEHPVMILAMLARQFRILLQMKCFLESNQTQDEIAKAIGIPSFTVKEYISQGRHFSKEILLSALKDCLTTDIEIKTGQNVDRIAVEVLIYKYSGILLNSGGKNCEV